MYKTFSLSVDLQTLQAQVKLTDQTDRIIELNDYTDTLKEENEAMSELLVSVVKELNAFKSADPLLMPEDKSRDLVAFNFIEAYLNKDMDRISTYLEGFEVIDDEIYNDELFALKLVDIDSYRLNSFKTEEVGSYYSFIVYKHPSMGVSNSFFINIYVEHVGGMNFITELYTDI